MGKPLEFKKGGHYLDKFIIAYSLACSLLHFNCVFLYT